MILAAGRGERMRPLTDHTPKPLLEVGGKPLIVWQLEKLARAGFRDVVINHAHLGEKIEQALGDGQYYGLRIRYSPERVALETAGGIARALGLLGYSAFAVVNGDVFTDYDFRRLLRRARTLARCPDRAHLILVSNPKHHRCGDYALETNRVRVHGRRKLTFSGMGVYKRTFFAGVRRGSKRKLVPLLNRFIAQRRVGGEFHDGRWVDVGTVKRLQELDRMLRSAAPAHDG
ncbi:MAG: N-acetylmuramate alpha-1-phosphate uridylyltransferase MurU [Burkholderiales bacterium]